MTFFLNLVLIAALLGLAALGTALFWIARQDDSRAGRTIGMGSITLVIFAGLYVLLGRHWF